MMDRRLLLVGASAALLAPNAWAQQASWTSSLAESETPPPLPPGLEQFSDLPDADYDPIDSIPQGTDPPLEEEVRLAQLVLDGAPRATTPLEVARYFLAVGEGAYGEELRPYIGAWPVRWNPVLVEFFNATRTRPMGDVTPWCAAFLNWCLMRAREGAAPREGVAAPTASASSGSFRTWGAHVDVAAGHAPRPGDVVVFQRTDPTYAAAGRGHVGFFVREEADRVLVLGGNQFEGSPRRHVINAKWLRKQGGVLVLHSYRTDAALHA